MEKDGLRREVGLALLLLLLLVAWELPLHTEADVIVPAAPPLVEVGYDDPSNIANHIVNREWTESRCQKIMNRAVDAAVKVVQNIVGAGVARMRRHSYRWFCRVWQASLTALHYNVDWALTFILRYIDHDRNFKSVNAFKGFTKFLLDLLKYPGKWALAFIGHGPFSHCFNICFPRCIRDYPPGMYTQIYCVLQLVSHCVYYDNHFQFPYTIPWLTLTANFEYYHTPPLGVVHSPFYPQDQPYRRR